MSLSTRHFLVKGLVQGVGFRYATQLQAQQSSITGWVRNLGNGDVEIVATGDINAIEAFEQWLWTGPQYAEVNVVEVQSIGQESHLDFQIVTSR